VVGPRFDLHHHEVISAAADEVELAAAGTKAGADDLVATTPQEVGRSSLAGAPEL
jgi:hypothetical protein